MKMATRKSKPEALLAELAWAAGGRGLAAGGVGEILARHPELLHAATVEKLADLAREKLRVDPQESLQYAEAALTVARQMGDEESQARGLRAKANALWFLNQNRPAVELYEQALDLFRRHANPTEVGRTLSSGIQPLIRLGEYDRAVAWVDEARRIFTESGDQLRLARLELNAGNIYHRQDRFTEALAAYEHAYQELLAFRDAEAIGAVLHNMALTLISTNDFQKALATHQAARTFCQEHDMPALVVQADYNVAYLYYLRGEYSRALEGLQAARQAAMASGDAYHVALCSMDQSEIFLELNMSEEAAEMAQEAFTQFQDLGMNYESAKSLVNLAIAVGQPGRPARSLELLSQAREIFLREKNQVWPSLIDLYQALLLHEEGRHVEARLLCLDALEFFRSAKMATKEILCLLLLARIGLRTADIRIARQHGGAALERLDAVESPHLAYQAHVLMAQIEEAAGHFEKAAEWYQSARAAAENLRDVLRHEDLKIAFMQNKLEVYESLIRLCLSRPASNCQAIDIFTCMEQAKSRSLRDLMGARAPSPESGATESVTARRMRELREELNWYYHRIELEQLGHEPAFEERVEKLRAEARDREKNLLRLMRETHSSDIAADGMRGAPALALDAIREALGPETVLVEYFRAGDRLLAAVVGAETLEVVPLGPMSRVEPLVRLLQFQFSKFRLGNEYTTIFRNPMLRATRAHLQELYAVLLEPVRPHLRARHLVFVPHESLHHLPLHALFDGAQYLADAFTISYAPSASVFALCHAQPANASGPSLVLGVPDRLAPRIGDEAQVVAATLPDAELYVGAEASQRILATRGPVSRVIHIGTHGRFRADNPMFSAIRLGDGYLTLYDLYRFRLPAELVALSGCSTGMNVIAKGDELLGLVRGLLHSGAKSLLLSLWDVQDGTTTELMKSFYGEFRSHGNSALALQRAMREIRERQPHPYFWAPFVLVGGVKYA